MRFLILALAMGFPVAAVVADDKPTPEEEREAKIYGAIADMIAIRDETFRKYALVMHGESIFDSPNTELLVRPSVIIKLVDQSRQFELTVRLQYLGQPPYREDTSSYLFDNGLEKSYIPGIASVRAEWVTKPDKAKPASERQPWELGSFFEQNGNFACPGCPPIDSYLVPECTTGSVRPGSRILENVVLREYELVSSEPAVNGVMETNWTWNTRWGDTYNVKIHFSAAYDMLPVRMEARNVSGQRFYASRVDWRKHKGRLLPYRVRFASDSKPPALPIMKDLTYRCYWLVGDEVPDEFFESENKILAVLDHFEIPHSIVVGDDVIRCEIGLPDDLIEDVREGQP